MHARVGRINIEIDSYRKWKLDAVYEPHCTRRPTIVHLGAPGIELVVTPVQISLVPRPSIFISVLSKHGRKREREKRIQKQAARFVVQTGEANDNQKTRVPWEHHAKQTITSSLRRNTNNAQHRRVACGGRTSHPPAISSIAKSEAWQLVHCHPFSATISFSM